MREKALQRLYWSGIWKDCNKWVTKCNKCATVKVHPKRSRASLGDMLVGAPLDRLANNILGPFPGSTYGNKYMLAVNDSFMKWVEIFTIPNQSAVSCVEVILDKIIGCYSCPCDIHSEQNWNYESTLFAELCQLLEI